MHLRALISNCTRGSKTLLLVVEKHSLTNQLKRKTRKSLCSSSSSSNTYPPVMASSWKNLPKPNVVFVLGGPGSGKGTQCQLVCNEFGYVHLSAGDLLRKEQNTPDSEFAKLIDGHIRSGTIVPVEITCSLLEKAMLEHSSSLAEAGGHEVGNFLIDGFPRNQDNLDGWKRTMEDKVNIKFVLFFECPKEICIERCLKRGQAGSGRTDDNIESMGKRLDTYINHTMPIVDYYEKLNCVKRVDASGDVNAVFEEVKKLFTS